MFAASRAARRLYKDPSTLHSQNPAAAVVAVQSKQTDSLHFLKVEAPQSSQSGRGLNDNVSLSLVVLRKLSRQSKEANIYTSLLLSRKLFHNRAVGTILPAMSRWGLSHWDKDNNEIVQDQHKQVSGECMQTTVPLLTL